MTLTHPPRPDTCWTDLLRRWQSQTDLRDLEELLIWDQSTQLPQTAGADRGRLLAQVAVWRQDQLTDATYGRALDDEGAHRDRSPAQQRLLALARRERDRAERLPRALVQRTAELNAEGYGTWVQARATSDFQRVAPVLERLLDTRLETAAHFPEAGTPMDHFIDQADEGFTRAQVSALFAELQPALQAMLRAAPTGEPGPDPLAGPFDVAAQRRLAQQLMTDLGFDPDRGAQAQAPHPFMVRVGQRDIRIATRFDPDHLAPGLFSTLHETGHALYEQGVGEDLLGTPAGFGASAAVHESQARLWENLVGRSLPFWSAYLPDVQAAFAPQLGGVDAADFHRAVNRVSPGLIRVQADELTYNLHIIVRYQLECALLDGALAVRDLPDAWNAAYETNLGLTPPDHARGVLQDVHWYAGQLGGAFHSYALGNLMAAQLFRAAQAALPDLHGDLERRSFTALHGWLARHVYRHGGLFRPAELIEQVTGSPLGSADFITALTRKVSPLTSPTASHFLQETP
ncbi:carboxypeptidase M32 [Deinococcus ficus]|uniref:carboxypeptidase M32 n=1 Tax=Deinococcus ficus TaxID=317577 RepID=UPI0003B452B1|nr:carboxypeptidase M32 [Deinococcus ficus]